MPRPAAWCWRSRPSPRRGGCIQHPATKFLATFRSAVRVPRTSSRRVLLLASGPARTPPHRATHAALAALPSPASPSRPLLPHPCPLPHVLLSAGFRRRVGPGPARPLAGLDGANQSTPMARARGRQAGGPGPPTAPGLPRSASQLISGPAPAAAAVPLARPWPGVWPGGARRGPKVTGSSSTRCRHTHCAHCAHAAACDGSSRKRRSQSAPVGGSRSHSHSPPGAPGCGVPRACPPSTVPQSWLDRGRRPRGLACGKDSAQYVQA